MSNTILSVLLMVVCFLCGAGCRKPSVPGGGGSSESSAPASPVLPVNLAPLGQTPAWESLDGYAQTMPEAEFRHLLENFYTLPEAWRPTISLSGGMVRIARASGNEAAGTYDLPLRATDSQSSSGRGLRYWRMVSEIPWSQSPERPLQGLRIVLDPGHIGGAWAKIEERYFKPDDRPPVCEGNHTLQVAQILQEKLRTLGATVTLLRKEAEPLTPLRPKDLLEVAREELLHGGIDASKETWETPHVHRLKWNSEKLFYRTAEIRARAALVNAVLRPDFVICLHFNAEGFSGFTTANHFHMLVNGAYAKDEVWLDDQRYEMLSRLLSRTHEVEVPLNAAVARGLASVHGLPAYVYRKGAIAVPGEPFVWARNLLANRLYQCPVAYCEPYLMDNAEVYARLLAGDFTGKQEVVGKLQRSIYQEYAQGVADGVLAFIRQR